MAKKTCKEKWLTSPKAAEKPLLPGIPDEITFAHIVPKLAWRDFYILSAVSRAWCHANRCHHVYDARVHSGSTKMFILFSYEDSLCSARITLYSRTDNACYELPLDLHGGLLCKYKCVALNGKVYLLGVFPRSSYVFDLAGQKQWQKSEGTGLLEDSRWECGVLDGKIYAFGGSGSRVFDPVAFTCSVIKRMPSNCYEHRVAAMGDELFVYGKKSFDPLLCGSDSDDDKDGVIWPHFLDVYHPARDEWTVDPQRELMGTDGNEVFFMAQGKFHSFSRRGIHVYNADQNLWTCLHSFSCARLGPGYDLRKIIPRAVVAVDDELFAIVEFFDSGYGDGNFLDNEFLAVADFLGSDYGDRDDGNWGAYFIRSGGLGSENKELEWEIVKIPFSFGTGPRDLLDVVMTAQGTE